MSGIAKPCGKGWWQTVEERGGGQTVANFVDGGSAGDGFFGFRTRRGGAGGGGI